MKNDLVTLKGFLTAALTALGAFLGWKGVMLVLWTAVMGLDYLSGTMAACKEGQWSSEAARQGLWHKGAMILVVLTAAIADVVMVLMVQYVPLGLQWPGLLLPLVLGWYILTELGSILENAVEMGARVPHWLVTLLKTGIEILDREAEEERAGLS